MQMKVKTHPRFTTEQKIESLERRYMTLYNRAYARNVRRQKAYAKETAAIKNWVKRMEGLPLQKLAWLCTRLKNGRQIMTLDRREQSLLRAILQGRVKARVADVDNNTP